MRKTESDFSVFAGRVVLACGLLLMLAGLVGYGLAMRLSGLVLLTGAGLVLVGGNFESLVGVIDAWIFDRLDVLSGGAAWLR